MKAVFVSTGFLTFDDYPYPSHGTSIQIWGIARELAKRGHTIYIARRSNTVGVECYENVNLLNFKIDLQDSFLRENISTMVFSLIVARYVKSLKPDIIYLRSRQAGFFPAKLNSYKVFTVTSPDACDFFKSSSAIHNHSLFYYKKWLEGRILSNVDAIIVMNQYMKEYFHRKGFSNIEMIPGGVDLNEFPRNIKDDNFILYAGRLDVNRQIDLLIDAFSRIKDRFDTDLIIIGGSFYGDKTEIMLKKYVKKKKMQNRVHFIPWIQRSKLLEYMARCSFFVLPSRFEMHGNVTLEAMACSKPVIASNTIGSRIFITQGYNGFLFRKNDTNRLQYYLEMCLSDNKLTRKLGRNARKTIEERFTLTKIAEQYFSIYQDLVNFDEHSI